jgi:hypothetical protein
LDAGGWLLSYRWAGYDEALLVYSLGLGSPTNPLPAERYAAWLSTYRWEKIYDHEFIYSGPLFVHQLSHVLIDFRGFQDAFMLDTVSPITYFAFVTRETFSKVTADRWWHSSTMTCP